MSALEDLQSALGHRFRDPALLALALTHPSVAHEDGGSGQNHNQRLEFLGDAVIQLAVTSELYHRFPGMGEGALTQARAQLVNRTSLAAQALRLALGDHVILSRGEESSGGRTRSSTLADAFEAIIGAVYVDAGFETARQTLLGLIQGEGAGMAELPNLDNPKGELQEFLQATSPEAPRYELLETEGPDHNRTFRCAVLHSGVVLARGEGRSKKAAESHAAFLALQRLKAPAAT
ncbi:MAG: ribonuclease III [Verrucomicrobiota bacterium]